MITELILFFLIISLIIMYFEYRRVLRKLSEVEKEYTDLKTTFDRKVNEEANRLASKMFSEWRERELSSIKEAIREEFEAKFEKRKAELESELERRKAEIGKDAIRKSISVILGKISEYIAPLIVAEELKANPKDFRYIGTPIDYIVFKGLSDGKPEEIIFLEIKASKNPRLSDKEKAVKDLVIERKVSWRLYNLYRYVEEAKMRSEEELEKVIKEIIS